LHIARPDPQTLHLGKGCAGRVFLYRLKVRAGFNDPIDVRFGNVKMHGLTHFPASSTSCSFGGPELTDLYVTTGLSPSVTEEHAGKIFVVRNAGKGIPQVGFQEFTTAKRNKKNTA
jgi:hypothetical protein